MNETAPSERSFSGREIAVVGMSCRFPGAADVAAFWANLAAGVESIARFSPEEMRAAGVDERLLGDPRWVGAKAVVEGEDLFDAAFFGFTPREAEILDPQHRLFLECAWQALEHAEFARDIEHAFLELVASHARRHAEEREREEDR